MGDWTTLTTQVSDATYRAWNEHDADAVAAVFAAEARSRDAGTDEWEIGPEAVRARAAMLLEAFSDFRLERQVLVIDGPRHADRWIMTGTNDGAFLGSPATGRPVRVEGATFTKIDEQGLVVEDVHHVDYGSLFTQLGLS